MKSISFLTSLALTGLSVNANAALLSIDFGTGNANSPVQSGFTEQTAASALHPTTAGDITVETTGARFSRGLTTGPSPALFTDFTFANSLVNPITLTLSGAGIAADTEYEILFYSYDPQHGASGGTVTYTGTSGTVGSTAIAYSNAFVNNNSSLTTWTSNGSGQIVIDVMGTTEGPRVNGFEISAIPEPSAALLGAFGMLALLRRRR